MAAAPPFPVVANYGRVLGFAYQVVGDVALASRVAEKVVLRLGSVSTEVRFWRTLIKILQAQVAQGMVVDLATASGEEAALQHALHQLTADERMLLLLRYHEHLDLVTLAAVLRRPEREVRIAINEARRKLLRRRQEG